MREPGRVKISWQDGDTLRIYTDAGEQTRFFHFAAIPAPGKPSRQGRSVAEWEYYGDIHDPQNLLVDYITSSNFKRESDDSRWNSTPCSLR